MGHQQHQRRLGPGLLGLGSVVLLLLLLQQQARADIDHLKNVQELFEAAKNLESVHMQITEQRKSYAEKRHRALYAFAREPKSAHCDQFYGQVVKTINEYRIKAYQYVADSKKQTGWFGNIMKMVGPINSLKGLGKIDPTLAEVTERYESQSKSGILQDADVDCDMLKFHIRMLNKMMFVLQTDIKYMAIEQPQVLNKAIYHQLARNDFVANNNFYEITELSPGQTALLRDFYLARVDISHVKVGQAVERFSQPGNFIIGRLFDSCRALVEFQHTWAQLEGERAQVCLSSKSDLKNELFASQVKLDDFESSMEFCEPFLNSL